MEEQEFLQKAQNEAREGNVKEALTTLKRAIESHPDSWRATLMMGQILMEVGHANMAVSRCGTPRRSIPTSSKSAWPWGTHLAGFRIRGGHHRTRGSRRHATQG
ncbi:tetratricopeptide repeat protein [candidate division KSB1 bacterium]|nr:tetratricopeptide repeat protein [candidate division KSB1 bacterium]NIR70544.1 tetratricopeptide repeat protein [candidate division KSB1 bacterium]NIS26216.1 tetratricopeptide repeat protein [candidate division KSB1 bacterium]NIT72995.1 tetratricopeptide repeat protein [candidate division KSB1 bacterium]NIU26864.1 tetratricopeptide repeat protein [candidate division KSB1 bacterium]